MDILQFLIAAAFIVAMAFVASMLALNLVVFTIGVVRASDPHAPVAEAEEVVRMEDSK